VLDGDGAGGGHDALGMGARLLLPLQGWIDSRPSRAAGLVTLARCCVADMF